MKKIKLHVLLAIFMFSHINGMDLMKDNPFVTLIAAVGIPLYTLFAYMRDEKISNSITCTNNDQQQEQKIMESLLWLKTLDGKLISLTTTEAKKYPPLSYYIDTYGKNSENSPLKIGSEEGLALLASQDIEEFLRAIVIKRQSDEQIKKQSSIDEKLTYALEGIDKELCCEPALGRKIAQFLQQLHNYNHLSFVFNNMLYHNMRLETNYQRKYFFNNKKFYFDDDGKLYNREGKLILVLDRKKYNHNINNGLPFIPAKNGNVVLTQCFKPRGITLHNLETGKNARIDGDEFIMFEISSDARYVALHSAEDVDLDRGIIQIYDIQNIDNIHLIAKIEHTPLSDVGALDDFVFSPDGSKLISWSKDEVILWDLQDITNIGKKVLLSDINCKLIVFNSDNEHIVVLDAKYEHEVKKSEFYKIKKGVILNINNPEKQTTICKCDRAYVFPENSDVILLENGVVITGNEIIISGKGILVDGCIWENKENEFTTIFNKTGKKLPLQNDIKDFTFTINGNYIFAQKNGEAQLFDHNMNFLAALHSGYSGRLSLEPSTENAIIPHYYSDRLPKKSSYWQLPDPQVIISLRKISDNITPAQLIFLEKICEEKRKPKEPLLLSRSQKSLMTKAWNTFGPDSQKFLKEQLYLQDGVR